MIEVYEHAHVRVYTSGNHCFSVQSFEETTNKYRQHDICTFVYFIFVQLC